MNLLANRIFAFLSPCILCLATTLGVLGAASIPAQQPLKTLIVDVDHRPATSLNGDWHYLVIRSEEVSTAPTARCVTMATVSMNIQLW